MGRGNVLCITLCMYQLCHHHVKKIYISIFFREKKIQNKTKEFSVKTKSKKKKKRERTPLVEKKWNDDICDIFPYDTFYRLETKVTKNKTKTKKHTEKKLVLITKFTKLL